MSLDTKFPTEIVELPSKGLLYPEDSPLASGKIEMKYMTAKEEDILTNQNFIKNGTVIDKLLKELIVTPIDYTDLTTGDKNAIMIARITPRMEIMVTVRKVKRTTSAVLLVLSI